MPVTVTIAAKKLRRLLECRHMGQADLARRFEVKSNTVSYWMKGRPPALDTILALVKWSENYLKVEDFRTPHRRNVAIPEPPSPRAVERVADPFVEVPKDRYPKILEETLYLNGYPPITISNIDREHKGLVLTEGAVKVIIGENNSGKSAFTAALGSLIDRGGSSC